MKLSPRKLALSATTAIFTDLPLVASFTPASAQDIGSMFTNSDFTSGFSSMMDPAMMNATGAMTEGLTSNDGN